MMRHIICCSLVVITCLGACNPSGQKSNSTSTGDPELSRLEAEFEKYPDSIALADRIIDTLANRGSFSAAAAWCDTLLRRQDPQLLIYQLVKADMLVADSQYPAAINAYRAYLDKNPGEPVIYLKLANTMAEAKDKNTLLFCDSLLLRFDNREQRSGSFFVKGYYLNSIGKFADARPWLDSAIRLNYNFTEAWMEKGYGYFDDKEFAKAAGVFEQLTALQKDNAEAWYWVGKANEFSGRKEEALDGYAKAASLDPNIAEAKEALDRLSAKQ